MSRLKYYNTNTHQWEYADISTISTPDVSGQINTHNTATDAHNDIRLLVEGLSTRLNALADSDDITLDQMSEVVAYIKNNKSLIEGVTNNKVNVSDIIDNLTTNVANKPLSAAQGVALKALIDAINTALAQVKESCERVINIKEKYGLDDSGAVDCAALINQAVSEANNGDTLYLPNGKYKIESTVTINKAINILFDGVFNYTGVEFAFEFYNFSYSEAKFREIAASNGSCIKLRSNWATEKSYIQYSRFIFSMLRSKKRTDADNGGYCFYVDCANGWVNENRFIGGHMTGGYGVYVDCLGSNAFNGNIFDSCGVEGIGVGFYFANNCRNNMIFGCRHSENFTKFIQTVGVCYSLKVISNSPFKISDNDISTETSGFVIATLMNASGGFYGTYGTFVNGTVVCEESYRTKNLLNEPTGVFDLTNSLDYNTEYKEFIVDGPCTGIKLNKKYGAIGGINEFYVKFANANTKTFTITDYAGNVLSYIVPQVANSLVRFYWVSEIGW